MTWTNTRVYSFMFWLHCCNKKMWSFYVLLFKYRIQVWVKLLLLFCLCLSGRAGPPPLIINCLVPWGTEAIPRVRCYRQNGSEQKERWLRFGPTPCGVRVHPPRRGAPDRCGEPTWFNIMTTSIVSKRVDLEPDEILIYIESIGHK